LAQDKLKWLATVKNARKTQPTTVAHGRKTDARFLSTDS